MRIDNIRGFPNNSFHPAVGADRSRRHPLEAVKQLGWSTILCHVVTELDDATKMLIAERDENVCRKDFSPREAVAIGMMLEELERPKAKARQGQKGRDRSDHLPELSEKGLTREKVGRAIGMSGTTYNKAKSIIKAAENDPEIFGPIADEMDRTGNVLDGHNRVAICDELGIECPAEVIEGLSDAEKRQLAYDLNLHRRHLNQE